MATTNPDAIPEDTTTERKITRTLSTGSDSGGEERPGRKSSVGIDTRWRTASFSEPGRIVVVAVDSSDTAKNSFDCKEHSIFYVINRKLTTLNNFTLQKQPFG